jgi:rod shape-determining protein MreC
MPKNKLVFGFIATFILIFSLKYSSYFKQYVIEKTNNIRLYVVQTKDEINNKINKHIRQAKHIEKLQKQVNLLQPSADKAIYFASKLNQLLNESNLTSFNPSHHLSRVISYEHIDNPLRMWIELPKYNPNKRYGLVHNGFTAGIVYPKFQKPLAYLQLDQKVLFSVLVGEEKEIAVIFGNKKNMLIKYIPSDINIKLGDEVITSGKDGLFYEGVKVGKIIDIKEKSSYKIATVQPYLKNMKPNFFYAIDITLH